jgi:sirohydrochlorin cobaltochelatase
MVTYLKAGLVMMLGISLAAPALAGNRGQVREMKKGILLVAFGTSVAKAQVSFRNIEEKVKDAYPDIPVRWAYTSKIIRNKLAKSGQHIDSPEAALAKMMDEGFTHVAVQSLHTIAGEEFHDLQRNVNAFRGMAGGFTNIQVGYPLLGTQDDLERVAAAMIKIIPGERKKSDAVVLMGHGTPHPANAFYAAIMYHFQEKDPNIFVGTVEGSPEIGDIKNTLLAKKIKKAYLIPFMSVAGDHAMNDMAGAGNESWQSILSAAGITCVPILKGTAEYADIVAIWVDHLSDALSRL